MWGHMVESGCMMAGSMMILRWLAAVWFVVFTALVVL